MRGIYFINNRISLNGLSWEDSFKLQEEELLRYIEKQQIQIVKLDPYQIYRHYTILHALLYDLKQARAQFDCLTIYSPEVIEDFVYAYPARWLLIKSYFEQTIPLHSQ
ncbi:hypothetical protein [Bacillus sp. T33-2]|uniref:hypothetical protein n=1 Tax=Bacillus sp. T33-2 TaxID=2054168 RepID=UPI000C779AE7|nr:hypothetical protein [Bacillus sp. T33-2]PLR91659.1 hypothetical protein CVD19_21575 [Bacillus sp. T33-2]